MNIHPVDVYKSWISKTESETGTQSALPYDVTAEQVSPGSVQCTLSVEQVSPGSVQQISRATWSCGV